MENLSTPLFFTKLYKLYAKNTKAILSQTNENCIKANFPEEAYFKDIFLSMAVLKLVSFNDEKAPK